MEAPEQYRSSGVLARASGPILLLASACADYRVCSPVPPRVIDAAPERLSQTGLYADIGRRTLAPDVVPFAPRQALWSDGTRKQRWIWLPPGTQIDTSDVSAWRFPVGTKLWKEFSSGATRLETRLLERIGAEPDAWVAVAYAWSPDQADALVRVEGGEDVLGSTHDVPAAETCWACHGGRASVALGFSAFQLGYAAADPEVDLAWLEQQGRLSAPLSASTFDAPGGALERDALAYLHANCGHCHNRERPPRRGARCFDPENDYDFFLRVDHDARVDASDVYRSALGAVIVPGAPDDSELIEQVSTRGYLDGMPPLATEHVDATGVALLRRWIGELPHAP